jgi:microsomal dipeptidase-like Zn-dependent dipeptidase
MLKFIKRTFFAFILVAGARLALMYGVAPLIDRLLNRVQQQKTRTVREETAVLHNQLFIADLHSDPYLWNRDLRQRHSYGHIDLPRLIEGNVALQTVGVAAKIPWGLNFESNPGRSDMLASLVVIQGWPVRTWRSLHLRALYHAERLQAMIDDAPGDLLLVRRPQDLDTLLARRQKNRAATGFLLGLEGVHALEGELANLDELYAAGFRLLGLTHFFDNEAGGSAHGRQKGGLTPFGRDLIRAAEAKKMIIDLAHASAQLIEEVCELATRPVIASHTGVRGTCDTQRNLSDHHVRLIAESGGLIGIAFFAMAVGDTTVTAVVRAMRYVAELVGVEHVAIGTDFDGAVTAPIDASGMPLLTEALLDDGFTAAEVAQIMGGNVLRFLRETLPD